MSDSESVISSSHENEGVDDTCDTCTEFTEDSYDEENSCTIRGKWIYDGSVSIDEMIACLQKEIEILRDLKESGWYLVDKVNDDYAILRRDPVDEPREEVN